MSDSDLLLLWSEAASFDDVLPPGVVLPELVTRGLFFAQDTGAHWTAIQCSDFNLFARYLANEDIRPVLQQRASCGFNMLRVWTLFDIPTIGTLTTCDYDRVPAFVALCGRYGLYVELCAYTGINDPNHWDRLCRAALACTPRPLLELVNELDQNTNEPDSEGRVFDLSLYDQAPAPLLSSRGSNGSEHYPVGTVWNEAHDTILAQEYWSYCTMHFNDASEWIRKVGHNAMEVWHGPTLANENTRYCDKATSTAWAEDAAAGAALLCAGSCFHSEHGKTSVLWDEPDYDAADAWAYGAKTVDLSYQDGAYRHPIELETPDLLRVYQRVYPDARGAWTVEIRR